MRRKIGLVILLGITLFVCGLSISSASPDNQEKQKKERSHHKKGAEVGKRIRDLRKYNSRLHAALSVFERKAKRSGHSPKIDEAESITMDSDNQNQTGALRMANSPSPF